MYKKIIFGILILSLQACDNPMVLTPVHKNTVTGMYWTGESGPETIAVWGNPQFPGAIEMPQEDSENNSAEEDIDLPLHFALQTPYPNPADGNNIIGVTLPRSSHIKLWLETAYFEHRGNIPFQRFQNQYQNFLIFEDELKRGHHLIQSVAKSRCSGGELNDGFYRVFLQVNGVHLFWQDIYIVGCKSLPNIFNNITQNWYY